MILEVVSLPHVGQASLTLPAAKNKTGICSLADMDGTGIDRGHDYHNRRYRVRARNISGGSFGDTALVFISLFQHLADVESATAAYSLLLTWFTIVGDGRFKKCLPGSLSHPHITN